MRGAGRGCPPRLPILASRAPRQPQRPPDRPRARAEAAGVAAEGIPSPRRVRGRIRCGRGAAGGAATGEPPQLPRAPAAHGGTCRPTARAWSEDREPGAAPPPPARTLPSLRRRAARADRLSARRGEGMPPRLPILASRAPRELQRPPAGRRRARRLRGSPRRHALPAPGPRGRFAAAGGRRGCRGGDLRRSARACGMPGGRRGSRGARDRGRGSRRGTPAARPHRHRVFTSPNLVGSARSC